ncbi:MAG TPA: hypothetical protein VF789_22610 [Thermoanaerobaculia bacterium]
MVSETLTLEPPTAVLEAERFITPLLKRRHNLAIVPGDTFYDNPNLWIRNAEDKGTVHQDPKAGKDNWFYARVTNNGSKVAETFWVTFNVLLWPRERVGPGTEFFYPQDFFPFINIAAGTHLQPGTSQIVHAKWPAENVPVTGSHSCILATVQSLGDLTANDINVWESDNLAQKNATVVAALPGASLTFPFHMGSLYRDKAEVFRLEVRRPQKWPKTAVSLVSPDAHMEKIFKAAGAPAALLHREGEISTAKGGFHLAYHQGSLAGFPVTLPARTLVPLELRIDVPKEAKPGDVIETHLVQRNRENKVVGGFVVKVNVIAK